jgi:hypothetical protein
MSSQQTRLEAIEHLLGLLPSGNGWQERAVYLAFLLAGDSEPGDIAYAMDRLEEARPGFLREAEDYARDMVGHSAAALLRPATEAT